MISFFCSNCGLKFQVNPEFAGRSSRCPTCKEPLIVPLPDKTQAEVAAGQIDGTDSSLAKAGVDGGVTLEHASPAARSGQRSVLELLARRTKNAGRYIIESEIARGGMGTVLRAVDCDIRREVAVKYLLDQSDTGKKLRFIEEAQITGQLEHPNIVPIHELGVDNVKRLFFSMKMVKGRSLAQVLDELRHNPRTTEFTLGRLLHILVNVCNALAYAHSRGVVHRDLKPANIMIGDFGEVYVMDWGLAKVRKGGQAPAAAPLATVVAEVSASAPAAIPVDQTISVQRSSKVDTSRMQDADLTQEGAVMGTPVYMPPEQASGHVDAIDQRSDVYSLGAILYEMLALQPPIDKAGGYLDVLVRVMQGEIVPPERRAGVGRIPRELSAIAMKALARNPRDRYSSVEDLRRDIERYQEGRSVSAKGDRFHETVWKLVKRNKLASSFTAVLALVLLWGSWVNWQARRDAERANARVTTRTEKAVPALVGSARLLGNDGQFQEALEQVDLALEYQPTYGEAKLLKGQLLIANKDLPAGRAELERYVRQRPQDTDARKLMDLCAVGKMDDPAVLFALAEVFQRQKASGLAVYLLKDFSRSLEVRRRLLALYQKQIEAAWPGLGNRLHLEQNGEFRLNLIGAKQVTALHPLKGMQLHSLNLDGCDRIADLAPLRDMPLTSLNLNICGQISDLSPLSDLPLTSLSLVGCGRVSDLRPLKGLRLTWLNLGACGRVADLAGLEGMPLTGLSLYDCGQIRDLTPLEGAPLTNLNLTHCREVRDLSPLRNMPLTSLNLEGCLQVQDLTPLKGKSLTSLTLGSCVQMRDVTPLQGMNLTEIMLTPKFITTGMDVLRQMKSLKSISTGWDLKERFSSDEFWKRYDSGAFNK